MYRLLLGQTVGNRYQVLSLLGRGGMGAVYLAMDATLERHVALKAVTLDGDPVRARFRREARLAASIRHPNVVTVHDFFSDERLEIEFLVMEHLEGEDLGQRVERAGPLAPDEVLELLAQAAEGVAAGHRAGLVHRDVKPGNLFLTRRGNGRIHVHVLDFGIARAVAHEETATHLTLLGHAPHSPGYASPEQWRGAREVTPASDVFSLAMSAWYALTGNPAFSREDLARLAAGTPVAPPTLPAGCPPALSAVLLRALHPDPDARYADADALLADLAAPATAPPIPVPASVVAPAPIPTSATAPPVPASAPVAAPAPIPASALPPVPAPAAIPASAPIPVPRGRGVPGRAAGGRGWVIGVVAGGCVALVLGILLFQNIRVTDVAPAAPSTQRTSTPAEQAAAPEEVRVDQAPDPASSRELGAAMRRHFPANDPGSARVRYVVRPDGRAEPGSVEVLSATSPAHRDAAVAVVNEIRFTPGRAGGRAVRATGTSTFNWQPRGEQAASPPKEIPAVDPNQAAVRMPEPDDGVWDISSVDVKPVLSNTGDVGRALEQNYPPMLRDEGVGGSVILRFVIGRDGRVDTRSVEISESDDDQFSEAAARVAERMRFRPARVNGRPVKVMVELPITFQPGY